MAFPIPNPVIQGAMVGQDQFTNTLALINTAIVDASQFNIITVSNVGAVTWTAAQVISGGCLVHSGVFAGGVTDVLDTAANIGNYLLALNTQYAPQPGNQLYPLQAGTLAATGNPTALNGQTFKFRLVNLNTGGAFAITLNGASTGVIYTSGAPGLLTVGQNIWRDFTGVLTVTGTNAAPVYGVTIVSTGTNAAAI